MSVIQRIRDKYARWAVIAIAVALTGFILMDYISGRSSGLFSGGNSNIVGRINGKAVNREDFGKKIEMAERNEEAQGQHVDEAGRQQIIEYLWKQEVDQMLLSDEYDKLGLSVGTKERTDMLYGSEPDPIAKNYFTNGGKMEYNIPNIQQYIATTKRGKDKARKEELNIVFDAMDMNRLSEKYKNIIAGTIHSPKWFLEKQNEDNSLMAKISYVSVPLSVIPDSAKEVAVSDKEIQDYIDKHKDQYKQDDETRSIEYVVFSAAPSAADTASTKNQVEKLKNDFTSTDNAEAFLVKNGSALQYSGNYNAKSIIQVPAKDSIFKLSKNQVYGPYLDKDAFVLAKLLDVKDLPDSVKARHILIQTNHPRTGEQMLEDSIAEKRIDSIWGAIKKGARFDSMALKFSDDTSSGHKGGLLSISPNTDYFPQGQMVQAFNDSCFFGKKGDVKKVKTEFGWHLIEILDQKNFEPHYKVAYFAKKIEASDETERNAENAARQFASEARDLKTFDTLYEKKIKAKGILKLSLPNISSHAFELPGIGVSRQYVKTIFKSEKGEVLEPERIGDGYVVSVVTEINKPGTYSVSVARPGIEPLLRNQKKAAELKKRIGAVTTPEAVIAKIQPGIKDTLKLQTMDSLRFNYEQNDPQRNNPLIFEYRVVGAAFNPANKGKVVPEPLEGRYGVYVVRVENVTAIPVENADINSKRKTMERQARMSILLSGQMGPYNQQQYDPTIVLRKAATIKDYRNEFY